MLCAEHRRRQVAERRRKITDLGVKIALPPAIVAPQKFFFFLREYINFSLMESLGS